MTGSISRQTHYVPSVSAPVWLGTLGEERSPEKTKGIHLRLEAQSAKFLALARIESEATAETLVEALLQWLQTAPAHEKQAIYQMASTLAQQRKNQGLSKRKQNYQKG
ncbi:hypothetical protein [Anthocerotibacter panamensis]|uniref:hypothetical protein n=1 Tax=Anthocerotibacter panamensis TaxID=2857077 RepID=UPI001C401904|nr:hypothetical protein [Anthocerotibacter panamensis]